jgi:hypothetical protein
MPAGDGLAFDGYSAAMRSRSPVPTTAAMPTSSPAKRRHRHAGLVPASTVPHILRTRTCGPVDTGTSPL